MATASTKLTVTLGFHIIECGRSRNFQHWRYITVFSFAQGVQMTTLSFCMIWQWVMVGGSGQTFRSMMSMLEESSRKCAKKSPRREQGVPPAKFSQSGPNEVPTHLATDANP